VKALASKFENICVVGDDAQSIYSFRGANIFNILTTQPVFMSWDDAINFEWYKGGEIGYINPFYSSRGELRLLSPTVLMIFFSFEELQNIKKVEFKPK
jgi:hypothetical protein